MGRSQADPTKGLSSRATNTVDRLLELHTRGAGNKGESLADAFSAVTDYYTHFSSGKVENVYKQVLSSDYGAGQVAKNDFWKIVQDNEALVSTIDLGETLLEASVA